MPRSSAIFALCHDAAPDRTRLVRYGQTIEKRGLYYLAITGPKNLARLDEIREANLRLADPRKTTPEQAKAIAESTPAIVWMAYGVHGDEISSGDAALLTAYHLLADRRAATREMLDKVVVILDPMQNPDGRDRFVNFHREGRGVAPDPEPLAAERVQRLGRRPVQSLPLRHEPRLVSPDPGRDPDQDRRLSPVAAPRHDRRPRDGLEQRVLLRPARRPDPRADHAQTARVVRPGSGRRQGRRFDQYGFPYTSREVYDAFYPGYGSTWPTLHGSIGILWEQAGARGLVIDRDDQKKLHYHDGVRHHYVSSISTVETAAAMGKELVKDFYDYRASADRAGA